MQSIEDEFLNRLAEGRSIGQDEFDQMAQDLPPDCLADALVRRYHYTNDVRSMVVAAQLYLQAEQPYQALEVCSRFPRVYSLQKLARQILPQVRLEYEEPGIYAIGKLLENAFLVIDLKSGKITRYPPCI